MLRITIFMLFSLSVFAAKPSKSALRKPSDVWYPEGENDSQLVSLLQQVKTKAARDCSVNPALPVGTHRLMKQVQQLGPKGNHLGIETGHYLLRNIAPDKVQAIVNLEFVPWKNGTIQDARKMFSRTRKCLLEMTPYLKGPEGQRLEIVALTPEEAEKLPDDMRPGKRTVKVSKEESSYRGNADEFGTNFSCITIGHEILHHLGLADEYVELDEKMQKDWACRQATVTPSYMADMWYTFEQTVPQTRRCVCDSQCKLIMSARSKTKHIYLSNDGYDITGTAFRNYCTYHPIAKQVTVEELDKPSLPFIFISESGNETNFEFRRATSDEMVERTEMKCTCPTGSVGDHCRRSMKELIARSQAPVPRAICPYNNRQIGDISIGEVNGTTRVEGNELILVSRGNGKSLLRPGHFKKIMAGNCRDSSASYEICAQYAYIGEGESCNTKPRKCSDDEYYLDDVKSSSNSRNSILDIFRN